MPKYSAYITDMAYALPNNIEENQKNRLSRKIGIERRHIAATNETAGDLALMATENLSGLRNIRDDIDFLIFCTQSPDYILPTTACILHQKLKLKSSCGAIDFNLGCSGFIYGLGLAKGLIESGQSKNVLLLTGETYSKYINPKDNSVRPLFGDAGTAVVISRIDNEESGIRGIIYGTDGSGANDLIIPVGGSRNTFVGTALEEISDDYGNVRTNRELYMNGAAVMEFALDKVPDAVEKILNNTNLKREDIDYYIFHQANVFVLNFLREKCKLMEYPYWNDVKNYGNTVSNSIPIAMIDMMNSNAGLKLSNVLLLGYGVGLSWGGCVVNLNHAGGG